MNISLILDPYGEDKPGGLGRAIYKIAEGITTSLPEADITVYLKQEPKSPLSFNGSFKTVSLGVEQLWLRAGKNLKAGSDLYVFLTPLMPLLFFPKKSIVVVHDFAYLELPAKSVKEKLHRALLRVLHKISLTKATAVVAVSESAKAVTVKYFHIPAEKITVIYNGFIPLPDKVEPLAAPEKFFLFAGVLKPRKNVLGVIHAFSEFAQTNGEYSLVIAGKTGGAYTDEAMQLVRDLGLEDRVRFVGYVTDAELKYLYTKAEALVFPSFIEGFGMPILEAMSADLPVITSNNGALAEVAGSAALLVDPHNYSDIARAMNRFAHDEALRQEYRERGKVRAAQFSWEKNAKEFSTLIKVVAINNLRHTTAI